MHILVIILLVWTVLLVIGSMYWIALFKVFPRHRSDEIVHPDELSFDPPPKHLKGCLCYDCVPETAIESALRELGPKDNLQAPGDSIRDYPALHSPASFQHGWQCSCTRCCGNTF